MRKVRVALFPTLVGLLLSGAIYSGSLLVLGTIRYPLLWWLLAAGLVLFVFYGVDKTQAQHNRRRIPELALHGLALAGGVFGGWLGMIVFRHKTQKQFFRPILLVAMLLWLWLLWQQP